MYPKPEAEATNHPTNTNMPPTLQRPNDQEEKEKTAWYKASTQPKNARSMKNLSHRVSLQRPKQVTPIKSNQITQFSSSVLQTDS
jgi:hypothetical protein